MTAGLGTRFYVVVDEMPYPEGLRHYITPIQLSLDDSRKRGYVNNLKGDFVEILPDDFRPM